MDERKLRGLIGQVKSGRMSRRRFVQVMVGAGLTVPMAGQMLLHSGVANAQQGWSYKPTKRGGGGQLKLLMWQGPTLLNPHFAVGTKDQYGCRVFYEPLAAWDGDGNLVPILADGMPTPAPDGARWCGSSRRA
jgi:peptide/nickel transport system substrate-binding protein